MLVVPPWRGLQRLMAVSLDKKVSMSICTDNSALKQQYSFHSSRQEFDAGTFQLEAKERR